MKSCYYALLYSVCLILLSCSKNSEPPLPDPDPDQSIVTVTDKVFQNYLLANYDTNKDDKLSTSEAEAIKELLISYLNSKRN